MQPDESNYEFLRRVVHATPGWLVDFTAILTMDLLAYQASQNARGSLLEIGVFQGRYFSILLRSALRTDSRLVGVDTFQYIAHDIVEKQLRDIFNSGMSSVTFVKAQSTDLTPVALLTLLGQPARFISIDGSHEKDDVYLDLALSDELLGPAGIIAVDDFLNPLAIGVNEAVNLYFRVPRRLVPFAYVPNKLLLSRPSSAGTYKKILEDAALADTIDPHASTLRDALVQDHMRSERLLFGQRVLMIP